MLSICNACRYCEGYCAVFPAIERRLSVRRSAISSTSPTSATTAARATTRASTRRRTSSRSISRGCSPRSAASRIASTDGPTRSPAAFDRNGSCSAWRSRLMLALFLIGIGYASGGAAFFRGMRMAEGAFYALMPHGAMAWSFGVVFVLAIVVMAVGAARFWRDCEESPRQFASAVPLGEALADTATLKYLGGGGDGCTYPDERPSQLRRVFHHFTFYGFMLCFAATGVATIYHYALQWPAPYPLASWPVVLGTLGGVGLLIGTRRVAMAQGCARLGALESENRREWTWRFSCCSGS